MKSSLCDGEIPGKNLSQHCQKSQLKKQEKFRLGPTEDLLKFSSMKYKRDLHGRLAVGYQHYTDSMEIPNPNQCQKTEHRGKTCQDGKSLDEHSVCCKAGGKLEDSYPRRCNANKEIHYEYIGPQDRKSLDGPKEKIPQPNNAQNVGQPMDAVYASVSQTYDAQKDSELALQGGTEATSQVSQSNKQPPNSVLLHEIPDPQPLTPSLTVNTTSASNQHQLVSPTTGKPRDTPSMKSTGNLQCPANSRIPAILDLPMQYNICDGEIPGKNS